MYRLSIYKIKTKHLLITVGNKARAQHCLFIAEIPVPDLTNYYCTVPS